MASLCLGGCIRTVADVPSPTEGVTLLGRLVSNQIDRIEKQPVSGLRVSISGTTQAVLSDEEGRFQFLRVPLGDLQIRISRSDEYGRLRAIKIIDDLVAVSDGQVLNLGDVELFGTGDLQGSVSLLGQDSSSGAEGSLVVAVSTPFRAVVDSEGKYRINDLPEGRLDLVAFRAGYLPGRLNGVQVDAGNLQLVRNIELEPGESESAKVEGEVYVAGAPDNAGVRVVFESASSSIAYSKETTTSAAGNFELALPIGIYNASFSKDGYVSSRLSSLVVLSEGTLGLRRIYLALQDPTDRDGDGIPDDKDPDDDNDGCADDMDQFPFDPEVCVDTDNDGIGDALDDDDDNDGLTDAEEINIGVDGWITDPENPDTDGDGVRDAEDLCPTIPDPEQVDRDMDGLGDSCDPFVQQDPPQITDIFPREGSVGTAVFIRGRNFNTARPEFNAVIFGENGGFASPQSYDSSDGLSVIVPEGAKTGFISLYNAFGSTTSTMSFTVYPRPIIFEVIPSYARPGQWVEVFGANLTTGNLQVSVEGQLVPHERLEVHNSNSIPPVEKFRIRVPALSPGSARVEVNTRGGNSEQYGQFEVSGRPQITLMQPNPVARGGRLFIFGNEMTSSIPNTVTQISFVSEIAGQRTFAPARVVREGLLDVTVPVDAVSGPVQLVLPTITTTSANPLQIDLRLPSLEFLDQTLLQAGDTVQISGYNLQNPQEIRFAGRVGAFVTANSGLIEATVPTTTVAGHIEIDFDITGVGLYTARSPKPFHVLTSSPAFSLPFSPNRHLIGINGIGTELFVLVGGVSQTDFELRRYDAETFVEINRTSFTLPQSMFPGSLDVSPNGLYAIITGTDGSSVGGRTNETTYILPIANPLNFVTCTGQRDAFDYRPTDRAFVFDSLSQYAYGKFPYGIDSADTGILRIDFTSPSSISCDTVGLLSASSGQGGVSAMAISDDNRSLVVMDKNLGLAHLNIVSTSTAFGTYSNWTPLLVNNVSAIAEQLFFDADTDFIWIPVTNTRELLRYDLTQTRPQTTLFGVSPHTQLNNAITTNRRWYVQSTNSAADLLVFVDLAEGRIATQRSVFQNIYQRQVISHPVQDRFFVKRSNAEVLRLDVVSP